MFRMFQKNLFDGKVVLVTGGATGIGKDISIMFANLGAKVAIAGRREELLKSACKYLNKETNDSIYVKTDIRDEKQVIAMFEKVIKKFGKIDILINNAGGQFIAPFEKISSNGFDAVVKTNLYGTWYCCKEAVKHMSDHGGKIINIVHIYALRAAPFLAHSGAARAGVVNLTKSLALELAKYKINVNAIAPGITLTQGFNDEMINNKKKMQELKDTIPLHRFADPKEIAGLVMYLCTDSASYITGQAIAIDGGQILANWPDFSEL
jgi:NAD(P)-dependent dehydrogenase (short-subunit alcohol dehydrogenase family)